MISKKSVIYRFLCIWWVLINMAPRNSFVFFLLIFKDIPTWCSHINSSPKSNPWSGHKKCVSPRKIRAAPTFHPVAHEKKVRTKDKSMRKLNYNIAAGIRSTTASQQFPLYPQLTNLWLPDSGWMLSVVLLAPSARQAR